MRCLASCIPQDSPPLPASLAAAIDKVYRGICLHILLSCELHRATGSSNYHHIQSFQPCFVGSLCTPRLDSALPGLLINTFCPLATEKVIFVYALGESKPDNKRNRSTHPPCPDWLFPPPIELPCWAAGAGLSASSQKKKTRLEPRQALLAEIIIFCLSF